ncbi:hypothetical protein L6R52_34665, partial [Myxococcota bacterium]|nr:hypothetical protein [Myxococcota bacterium]
AAGAGPHGGAPSAGAPGAAPSTAWSDPATPPPGADPAVWTIPDRGAPTRTNLSGGTVSHGTLSDGTGSGAQAPRPARTTVGVELASPRPARVVVDLSPAAAGRPLSALPLAAIDGSAKPALTGVKLTPGENGHVDVSVTIPADQPAGTYAGVVLDPERGTAAGTLTVVLSG